MSEKVVRPNASAYDSVKEYLTNKESSITFVTGGVISKFPLTTIGDSALKGYVATLFKSDQKARINEYMLFPPIPNKKKGVTAEDVGNDLLSKCIFSETNREEFKVETYDNIGNEKTLKRIKVHEDEPEKNESLVKRQKVKPIEILGISSKDTKKNIQ
eukprot:gene11551-4802_t